MMRDEHGASSLASIRAEVRRTVPHVSVKSMPEIHESPSATPRKFDLSLPASIAARSAVAKVVVILPP